MVRPRYRDPVIAFDDHFASTVVVGVLGHATQAVVGEGLNT